MPPPFRINRSAHSTITADCRARQADEACGALLADAAGRVTAAPALENVWPVPAERGHRFALDPLQQLRVERAAAASGLAVVGYYHSHPTGPAVPSAFDLERAWPGYVYVIIGLGAVSPDWRAWGLDESGAFVEHAVAIED